MAGDKLNGLRVAAIMTDGFEQVEFTSPRDALTGAGAVVDVVSPADKTVQGWNHHDKADSFDVDVAMDQANPEDYDAVLLPGGVINGDSLRMNRSAQDFLRQVDEAGKPIAVICHGPWTLISAGLVRGKRMTSYYTLQDDMKNAGAQWTDEAVVEDENFISSRNPGDLEQFNRAIIERFSSGAQQKTGQHTVLMEGTE